MQGQNSQISQIVLSVSKRDWLKTAMVVAKTLRECESRKIEVTDTEIIRCINALRDARQLESRGDLADWRHSELRLAGDNTLFDH
jgi:hypothetical protein